MSYALIYFSITLIIFIISTLNIAVYYYYKLYKLTKYSEVWQPFKRVFIGIMGENFGLIIMLLFLFIYLLTFDEQLFSDAYYNFTSPYAIGVIFGTLTCAIGPILITYGMRKFYSKMEKMVAEASKS